jgi:hypothetical protein
MPQLPDEIIEDVIAQAIVHAGDVTACSLALTSRRMRALSYALRWRVVHLLTGKAIYRFALLLGKLCKKRRALPAITAVLLWNSSRVHVEEYIWAPRGLKHALNRIFQSKHPKPDPKSRVDQGRQVACWAAARILEILSPQIRRIGVVTADYTLSRDNPLLSTHFPVLEELAVYMDTEALRPAGFDWVSATALPSVRRFHLELWSDDYVPLDWSSLAAAMPGLTHFRLSGILPAAVPALLAGASPLPPGVRRIVFSPGEWPTCYHTGEHEPIWRRINELPERVRENLRAEGGELAHSVALVAWQRGPNFARNEACAGPTSPAIASEFVPISGIHWSENDWEQGQLVLGREMDEALVAMAEKVWRQGCFLPGFCGNRNPRETRVWG